MSLARCARVERIDRIDDNGNIREHLKAEPGRTICGLPLYGTGQQRPLGNGRCGRCARIARARALFIVDEPEPCRSCDTRHKAGFDGQCPACAAARARAARREDAARGK